MKQKITLMIAVFLVFAVERGWAQSKATGKVPTAAIPTPFPNSRTGPAVGSSSLQNSNMHAVNVQIRLQKRQIFSEVKSGKLTKAQAQAQLEKLKAVRRQELEFFRQNGQREITSGQKAQLQQMLGQNAAPL
jgi:hypothetical protein